MWWLLLLVALIILLQKQMYNLFVKMSRSYNIVPMNEDICKENLFLFDDIMKKIDVDYWLSEGTALGAIREHGFIKGDDDVDVGTFDGKKFVEKGLYLLEQQGFNLMVITDNLYSFIRKDEKLDVDIVVDGQPCMACKTKHADCKICDEMFPFLNFRYIEFLGRIFKVPDERYLEYLYGDWKTPVKKTIFLKS